MSDRRVHVRAGGWRTVYEVFGSTAKRYGVFTRPAGAEIRVRYGVGRLGRSTQRQSLDGVNAKVLEHGGVTNFLRVRFQVRVQSDTDMIWTLLFEGPHTTGQGID